MFLTIAGIYFGGMIAFLIWDALIGFGDINFDGQDQPPAIIAAIFWPLTFPILALCVVAIFFRNIKYKRIERKKVRAKERLRIHLEEKEILKSLEYELEESLPANKRKKSPYVKRVK